MDNIWRSIRFKYIFVCILITFVTSCIISIAPISIDECKCETNAQSNQHVKQITDEANKHKKTSQHQLAILVPFRDRFEELLMFVPHMQKFLDKQDINYHIFILNQVDRYRFNRASLINVGFLETEKAYDYIAMHDVDLLPMNDQLSYAFPSTGPHHISSPDLHPRYHYYTFIGGILLIKREHFLQVNGMSNKYWGWGLEDDEFYVRLKEAGLSISRPQNVSTGTHNTFKHIHDRNHRKRDMVKCYNQREVTRKRDRQTGLNNVSYKIQDTIKMTISDTPLTVINISLQCDKSSTPWCECEKLAGSKDTRSKEKKKVNNSKVATAL
ncbi:beta-1,4-galactosyltransferase 7 [Harpegnathos saltator]|uniref:Beta-1,4-N-acetylgalactosaminyltransferase n=1 Tax=Harpegnathos saltator TaxID=610380 RepID=E2BNK8_HARSA|nr:beta-1,4-galactosyltransferase 7 [Harpegnathos saltator]EFN82787.1 Beta-1,4-galactosyltransferase 7 [Harpegnathos saltator]